jgi:hypothetical protein
MRPFGTPSLVFCFAPLQSVFSAEPVDEGVENNQKSQNHRYSHQCDFHDSSLSDPVLAPDLQVLDHLRCIQTADDEVGARSHHFCKYPFSARINECDLTQINDAASSSALGVRSFPSRPELSSPWTDQPPLKNPVLLRRRINDGDSQHCHYPHSSTGSVAGSGAARRSRPGSPLEVAVAQKLNENVNIENACRDSDATEENRHVIGPCASKPFRTPFFSSVKRSARPMPGDLPCAYFAKLPERGELIEQQVCREAEVPKCQCQCQRWHVGIFRKALDRFG